jgi:hypothetical protein
VCLHRAKKAADSGLFDAEIVPVTTKVKDEKGQEKTVTVSGAQWHFDFYFFLFLYLMN